MQGTSTFTKSALHSRCHTLPLLLLLGPFLYNISAHSMIVSSDTAIALAFGLLSTIIGLLGLLVGYLTLRAMPLGRYATREPPHISSF